MSITIRKIKSTEVSLLNSIYWDEYKKGTLGGALPPLSKHEIVANAYYFILYNNTKIIGAFGFLHFDHLPIKYNAQPHLMRLFIKNEFRGINLFRDIYALILNEAKKSGFSQLFTRISPSNIKMISILEKLGWERLGQDSLTIRTLLELEPQLYSKVKNLLIAKTREANDTYTDIIFRKNI